MREEAQEQHIRPSEDKLDHFDLPEAWRRLYEELRKAYSKDQKDSE